MTIHLHSTYTPIVLAMCALSPFSSCYDDSCSDSSDCDDGVFCNGDESCISGRCVSAGIRDCDDNITCTTDSCVEEIGQCLHTPTDIDGDGFFDPGCGGDDCDDFDPSIFPGAEEACDGIDNDCDGVVNEDRDGDGHHDDLLCSDGDDCDDDDATVYPGAPEVCDGVDNNCSGGIDDEEDTDGDGAIDETCGGDDCDDEDATISPLSPEVCNGLDDNCDGEPDELFLCIQGELYTCETECLSIGTIDCLDDCTFSDSPDACDPPAESCNGVDDDCDGEIDEDLPCAAGDLADCTTPCGSIGTGICTSSCQPAAPDDCLPPPEECNGIDDNCNGIPDEGFLCAVGAETICETTCGSIGSGLCTDECQSAAPEDCTPPEEVCFDLVDNDCDGDIDCTDEDCLGDLSCGG